MPGGTDALRLGLCGRRNEDSRAYKVLMNAAGDSRDLAIRAAELRAVARLLADDLDLGDRPDYLVGLAPGGIPITVALAYERDLAAVVAYKCRLALPGEVTWEEPHCVNSTFYLYGIEPGASVVLVDDEVDTGRTLCNATGALRRAGVEVAGVAAVVEILHSGASVGRMALHELGVRLTSVCRLDVEEADRRDGLPEETEDSA